MVVTGDMALFNGGTISQTNSFTLRIATFLEESTRSPPTSKSNWGGHVGWGEGNYSSGIRRTNEY